MTKVKAVIVGEDRRLKVLRMKEKKLEGKAFRHQDSMYFIHPDRFILTVERPWYKFGIPTVFTTYYFTRGKSNPWPVPHFNQTVTEVVEENGETVTKVVVPKVVDNGVPGEELEQLFNPYLLKILASNTKSAWEQIQFYLTIGTALGVVYLIWQVSQLASDVNALQAVAPVTPAPAMPGQSITVGG